MFDLNFLDYSNFRTLHCSITGFHVEARVEPDIKVHSGRHRALWKEERHPSSPSLRDTIYVS